MAHHTAHRHLRAVDDPTDGIPMGVTWQADEPVTPTRVLPATDSGALTPATARTADLADWIRGTLTAGNTYALLAWGARWDVAMGHVMDPALRDEVADAAERDLDRRRVAAARRLKRARDPEERQAAQRDVDRLQRRIVSELEVDARTLAARSGRLARKLALPAAVVVGPVFMAATGAWAGLLVWPGAWCWLAIQGRAHARPGPGATTVSTTAATELAAAPVARETTTVVGATVAENRVLARLGEWPTLAEKRGLDGVTVTSVTLDQSGIVVVLHTSGKLTPAVLAKRVDVVRAVLAVPSTTRMEITRGDQGDEAVLRVRTRDRDVDTAWRPGLDGIGVDADTGEAVTVDPYRRLLVAGESGAGKSVALRPMLAQVVADDQAAVVYIDAKRVEGALWRHTARIARTGQEITGVAAELRAEMMDRLEELETTGRASWTPTRARPSIVVVVDEGAEVRSLAKDAVEDLRSIAMMGRAAEIHLWWCTQKPTMSGQAAGIDPQVAAQAGVQICLKVRTPGETRTVLGEDATGQGWNAHELPMPGVALIRGAGRGPNPVRVWHMTDAQVQALPGREPWSRGGAAPEVDGDGDWIGAQEAVRQALADAGDTASTADLVDATGYSPSAVKAALGELRSAGRVTRGAGHRDPWRLLR